MTHIDFHTNISDKFLYTCRLVRKARASQCQIVILTSTANDLTRLDQMLWTFSEYDFLPHVKVGDSRALQTPIILTDSNILALPHHQVLINLSGSTPTHFSRFERMFEIISLDEADKNNGRDRYRFYQQRGYPLTHSVAASS
ncbi:MAG: DNA polymerase III subunit chi [Glaciimonas sp.]|nr:DNA polymerase III subunit chi [Glaciimonas sp.]